VLEVLVSPPPPEVPDAGIPPAPAGPPDALDAPWPPAEVEFAVVPPPVLPAEVPFAVPPPEAETPPPLEAGLALTVPVAPPAVDAPEFGSFWPVVAPPLVAVSVDAKPAEVPTAPDPAAVA
jgi:hypothetical protein